MLIFHLYHFSIIEQYFQLYLSLCNTEKRDGSLCNHRRIIIHKTKQRTPSLRQTDSSKCRCL